MTEISDTGTYPLPNIHARQSSLPSWMYKLSGRGYRYIFFIMKTIYTGLTRCMHVISGLMFPVFISLYLASKCENYDSEMKNTTRVCIFKTR